MLKLESRKEVVTDEPTLSANFVMEGTTEYPTLFKWQGINMGNQLKNKILYNQLKVTLWHEVIKNRTIN